MLSDVAKRRGVWVAFGILERDGRQLYDSAVIVSSSGEIALRYRRIDPHWHGPHADPLVYRQGVQMPVCQTPFGTCALMICGDLFDAGIVAGARALRPDFVVLPFSRCFGDWSADSLRWERDELPAYAAQSRDLGAPLLATGVLLVDDRGRHLSFGGAFVVDANGRVSASLSLGREGRLLVPVSALSAYNTATPRR
ncbi:MAG: carbon-nitrogen hydrolase family protein [Bacillota bacterium]|nr:carbon-nitrogen hydrolase family protein [Bacillota bacterium]